MGHNVDLIQMIGAPEEVTCPKCKVKQPSIFDDYDIDSGGVNPKPGVWKLYCGCVECEHEWTMTLTVTAKEGGRAR